MAARARLVVDGEDCASVRSVSEGRVYLLDASIYIFRAYFSMPDRWFTPQGMPLNAVYGYVATLLDLIAQIGPQPLLAAAFDESLGTNFRNEIYPGYKASRELPDEALAFQLEACRQVSEDLGIPCYAGPRYEADDYIATLATIGREQGYAVTVVTRDKDLGQLLRKPQDRWWDLSASSESDRHAFYERFGVWPEQFADYLALVGDNVDDIPGVQGIGPKSAATLLQHFESLDALAGAIDGVADLPMRGAAGAATRLQEGWEQVLVSRQLATLHSEVEGVCMPDRLSISEAQRDSLTSRLAAWGLPSALIRRLHAATRAGE